MNSRIKQVSIVTTKPYRREYLLSISASLASFLLCCLFTKYTYPLEAEYYLMLFTYPFALGNPPFIFMIINLFSLTVPYLLITSLWDICDSDEMALIAVRSKTQGKSFVFQSYIMLFSIFGTTLVSSAFFSLILSISIRTSLLFFIAHSASLILTTFLARVLHAYLGLPTIASGLLCFVLGYSFLFIPVSGIKMFSSMYPLYMLSVNEMQLIYIPVYLILLFICIKLISHKEKTKDYLGG